MTNNNTVEYVVYRNSSDLFDLHKAETNLDFLELKEHIHPGNKFATNTGANDVAALLSRNNVDVDTNEHAVKSQINRDPIETNISKEEIPDRIPMPDETAVRGLYVVSSDLRDVYPYRVISIKGTKGCIVEKVTTKYNTGREGKRYTHRYIQGVLDHITHFEEDDKHGLIDDTKDVSESLSLGVILSEFIDTTRMILPQSTFFDEETVCEYPTAFSNVTGRKRVFDVMVPTSYDDHQSWESVEWFDRPVPFDVFLDEREFNIVNDSVALLDDNDYLHREGGDDDNSVTSEDILFSFDNNENKVTINGEIFVRDRLPRMIQDVIDEFEGFKLREKDAITEVYQCTECLTHNNSYTTGWLTTDLVGNSYRCQNEFTKQTFDEAGKITDCDAPTNWVIRIEMDEKEGMLKGMVNEYTLYTVHIEKYDSSDNVEKEEPVASSTVSIQPDEIDTARQSDGRYTKTIIDETDGSDWRLELQFVHNQLCGYSWNRKTENGKIKTYRGTSKHKNQNPLHKVTIDDTVTEKQVSCEGKGYEKGGDFEKIWPPYSSTVKRSEWEHNDNVIDVRKLGASETPNVDKDIVSIRETVSDVTKKDTVEKAIAVFLSEIADTYSKETELITSGSNKNESEGDET